ncbi:hypothetical protein C8R43DRAFT_353791 [Mycena crocata]|nr:hypothetical protein C8R43DRAFT_353791 [Mycena crocata]
MSVSAFVSYEQVFRDVEIVRYTSAVSVVILIYDHILSLPDEVRFIWSARFTSSKFCFLALRYVVPGVMVCSTNSPDSITLACPLICKAWTVFGMLIGLITIAFNQWLVLLRLWVLCGRDRSLIICTLFLFLASSTTTGILTWLGVDALFPTLYFEPQLHLCIFMTVEKLRLAWLPGLIFQFIMLLAIIWKVLQDPKMLHGLHCDGYIYVIFLFVINLVNTIVFFKARISLVVITMFFMWCFTTTTTCRMILSLRRSSECERARQALQAVDESDDSHESSSQSHLPDAPQPAPQHIELAGIPRLEFNHV